MELKEEEKYNKIKKKCIQQRLKKIEDFNSDVEKISAKISKIYTDIIKKKIFIVKISTQ